MRDLYTAVMLTPGKGELTSLRGKCLEFLSNLSLILDGGNSKRNIVFNVVKIFMEIQGFIQKSAESMSAVQMAIILAGHGDDDFAGCEYDIVTLTNHFFAQLTTEEKDQIQREWAVKKMQLNH